MIQLIKAAAAISALACTAHARVIDMPARSLDLSQGNLTAEAFLAAPHEVDYYYPGEDSIKDGQLNEKRDCYEVEKNYWKLVGDGNPHQNYVITQVGETYVTCPGTIQKGKSVTKEWSIAAGLNFGTKKFEFGSVGFGVAVADTESLGWEFSCTNTRGGMCLQRFTAVTAVTVEFFRDRRCGGIIKHSLGIGTVYLPNANGKGHAWARGLAYGNPMNMIQCRGNVNRVQMLLCGPKGGPEYWDQPGSIPGPWEQKYQELMEPKGCPLPIEAIRLGDN